MGAGLPHVTLYFAASTVLLAVASRELRPLRTPLVIAAAVAGILAAHEASFFLRPVREWIRVDLLLSIPLAAVLDVAAGFACVRSGGARRTGWALFGCAILGAAALFVPG